MRVVVIVTSFAPRGVGENSFYRAPGGKWAQACAGCPQQRYATGESGNVQGRDRVVIVEGSSGYRAREVSIRFYRETRGTRLEYGTPRVGVLCGGGVTL